jgi:hypothetical protein
LPDLQVLAVHFVPKPLRWLSKDRECGEYLSDYFAEWSEISLLAAENAEMAY